MNSLYILSKKCKRAQSSVEYVLIVGFALMLMTPIILFSVSQIGGHTQKVQGEQLYTLGQTLVDAAQSVHFQGPPAKRTLEIAIPSRTQSINITDYAITFFFNTDVGTDTISVVSPVNLTGTLPSQAGRHRIEIIAQTDHVLIRKQP